MTGRAAGITRSSSCLHAAPTAQWRIGARCGRINQQQKTAVSERLILDIAF
jgi:hypothetical protein